MRWIIDRVARRSTLAISSGLALLFSLAHAQEKIASALESRSAAESRQQTSPDQNQTEPSQEEVEGDRIIPVLDAAIEAAIRNLKAEEDAAQRERQEQYQIANSQAQQDMVWWTRALVGANLAYVLLLWGTLIYTRRGTEVTRAGYVAAQRPWLNVIPTIQGDLTLHKDVAILDASITVENIGKSPAIDIDVTCDIKHTGDRWLADAIRNFAALHRITQTRNLTDHQGTSLFPNERITFNFPRLSVLINKKKILFTDRPYIALTLFVNVTYEFEFQERPPMTGVAYRLFRTDRRDGRHEGDFFLQEAKVPRDVLRLEASRGSLIQ